MDFIIRVIDRLKTRVYLKPRKEKRKSKIDFFDLRLTSFRYTAKKKNALRNLKTRYFSKNRRRTIIEREKSSLRRDITFLPFLAHFLLVLAQKTSLNKRNLLTNHPRGFIYSVQFLMIVS